MSIVICSFGRSKLLYSMLDSLFENTEKGSFTVVVVDNGSKRSTRDVIMYFSDRIDRVIFLNRNAGKPYAWNLGIMSSYQLCIYDSDLLPDKFVLCDSDLYFNSGWLNNMLNVYSVHEKLPLGVLSGFKNYVGNSKKEIIKAPGGSKLELRRHPPGCCWMISRKVIEKVGLFDSTIRVRGVDTQYSKRLWDAGYHNACVHPVTVVEHRGEHQRTWNVQTGKVKYYE